MRFTTETERIAHPQACLIPMPILSSIFRSELSDLQIELMSTPWDELVPRFNRLKVHLADDKIRYWICIALSHPTVSNAELIRLAQQLNIPKDKQVCSAALIGRSNIVNELAATIAPTELLNISKTDSYMALAFRWAVSGKPYSIMGKMVDVLKSNGSFITNLPALIDLRKEQVLDLFDTLRQYKLSKEFNTQRLAILEFLNSERFSGAMRVYLQRINPYGEPFSNFADEPAQISQIKKAINALYHVELIFKDTETARLRDNTTFVADAMTLLFHTVPEIKEAGDLVTHFDIDLREVFSKELIAMEPWYNKFLAFASSHRHDAKGLLSEFVRNTIPHKVGRAGGIVLDQLGPRTGEVDFVYLTEFSARLPHYLDQLTAYVTKHDPKIDKKSLDALQNDALLLLGALEQSRGSRLFLPLKAWYFFQIRDHITELSKSIFEQAGHLNESTQDLARASLAEIKYKFLPLLFELTDKVEEHAMLAPGSLSKPLMAKVSALYDWCISYTGKFVNFSEKGQELLTIEDSQFVRARVDLIYKRSVEDHHVLLKLDVVRNAAVKFFAILNKPQYEGQRIIDLPKATRQLLVKHYKLIQPYVSQFNMPLNNAIIFGLTGSKRYFDALGAPLRFVSSTEDTDDIGNVLLMQKALNATLAKIATTHTFNIKLNQDIIASVSNDVENQKLFPHKLSDNPFALNEANQLRLEIIVANDLINKPRPLTKAKAIIVKKNEADILKFEGAAAEGLRLTDLSCLTHAQTLMLYKIYQEKCMKLEVAREAYTQFHRILSTKSPSDFDAETQKKARNLYGIFQPYLVKGLLATARMVELDIDLVAAFSTNDGTFIGPLPRRVDTVSAPFIALHREMMACFITEKVQLDARRDIFANLFTLNAHKEYEDKPLVQEDTQVKRAHYIIKHQEASKAISEFRTTLYKLTDLLNDSVREKLTAAKSNVPFPEVEDINHRLAESAQVVSIKQLFNALYHLEQISLNLEKLQDNGSETWYAKDILNVGISIKALYDIQTSAVIPPSLAFLTGHVWKNLKKNYDILMEVSRHYLPAPVIEGASDAATGHNPTIFYTLNALMVLPEHIKALRGGKALSQEEIQTLHLHTKKVTTKIERIIAKSGSTFKLLLESYTAYQLFGELRGKLAEMAKATRGVAMDNLSAINKDLLTKILLETDQWEDSLGLIPGTLTSPMKEMLDTFYQGLLGPIGLPSQVHIALTCPSPPKTIEERRLQDRLLAEGLLVPNQMTPIEQRQLAANARVTQSRIELRKADEKHEVLNRLSTRMKSCREIGATSTLLPALKVLLIADFKSALPILKEIKSLLPKKDETDIPPVNEINQTLDRLLNSNVENERTLTNIEELATQGASYLQGLQASHQLTIAAALEKVAYLTTLEDVTQPDLKIQFTERYIKSCFDKQFETLTTKQVGLIHCSREYNGKLATYLRNKEGAIRSATKKAEADDKEVNIDENVAMQLFAEVKQFEQNNYKNYYHLETLLAAVRRLKQYVHQSNIAIKGHYSLFESLRTVAKKTKLVELLEGIALKEDVPIGIRITDMKDIIEGPSFKTKMLKYHSFERFTFDWLKQCIEALIELTGLFTPEYKQCYSELVKSAKTPSVDIGKLGVRFGLFAASTRGRAYDLSLEGAGERRPAQPPLA